MMELSDEEADLLFSVLEGEVMAWGALHDRELLPHLSAEQVLELCRRAGYSEEASQSAATRQANSRLDRGEEP